MGLELRRPGWYRPSAWLRNSEFPLTRRRQGERVIAAGRVMLAGFSWLAIGLEAVGAEAAPPLLRLALAAYFAYAVAYAVAVWAVPLMPRWLRPATHAFDLVCFSLLSLLSQATASPLFALFVFALVSATIRWQWQGALWTAVAALTAYMAMGVYSAYGLPGAAFELDLFLIRMIHLVVLALLLGYLGRHQHRLGLDLARLASWPRPATTERRELVAEGLERAARILGADRVLLVWQEVEEPDVVVADWRAGSLDWRRWPPGELEPWVPPELAERDYLGLGDRLSVYEGQDGLERFPGPPLGPGLSRLVQFKNALCLPLSGETLEGLLIACNLSSPSPDDLVTGRLVARILVGQLEQLALAETLARGAADQERIRLGRELHDGVTQSLAGAALQLEAAGRLIGSEPREVGRRLAAVQQQLEGDQRELREFVHLARTAASSHGGPLTDRLSGLADRIARSYGVEVSVRIQPECTRGLPGELAGQLYRLAQEALANAGRHAAASRIEVGVDRRPGGVRLTVADDGRGFPFVGRLDLDALAAARVGPWSLRQRVAALGGELWIDSSPRGATITVDLSTQAEVH